MAKVFVKSGFTEKNLSVKQGTIIDEKLVPDNCKDLVEPYDKKKHGTPDETKGVVIDVDTETKGADTSKIENK